MTVRKLLAEPFRVHSDLSNDPDRSALELLTLVGLSTDFADRYPHQLSGGMRQRVMIAIALACQPEIILADEPTTALDVTIQAQVLALMADLKTQRQMSMIFITHDLGVVAMIADRVAVMYAGHIVEMAAVGELFQYPVHPYTEALLQSIPRLDRSTQEVFPIRGTVPPIDRMPVGCRFADRCDYRIDICIRKNADLLPWQQKNDHLVRCWVRGDHSVETDHV